MRKIKHYINGFLIVLFIVFLYIFSYFQNSKKRIHDVQITFDKGENLFMSYQMVEKLLEQNNKTVKNQLINKVDLSSLKESILLNSVVENVRVSVTIDGVLKVKIRQRTPIARIQTDSGVKYIDRLGQLMPLSSEYSTRVPIVSGYNLEENFGELYEQLMLIYKDPFLKRQIVGVYKTKSKEFQWNSRLADHTIIVGNSLDLDKKIKKLKAFYKNIISQNKANMYTTLNLKYKNQVVCIKG